MRCSWGSQTRHMQRKMVRAASDSTQTAQARMYCTAYSTTMMITQKDMVCQVPTRLEQLVIL